MDLTKSGAPLGATLAAFLRQPSTVLGVSALVGATTALATGQLSWQGAVPAIAGALAAILLPDNTGAQAAIKDAAAAAVRAGELSTRGLDHAADAVRPPGEAMGTPAAPPGQ